MSTNNSDRRLGSSSNPSHERVINLTGVVKLSSIERELSESYSATSRCENIVFDLRRVAWIGYLPATLIFTWAAALIKKHHRKVRIVTPPYPEMSPQMRAIFLAQGLAERLQDIGAEIPPNPPPMYRTGQPLTQVLSIDDLWSYLSETGERIITFQKLTTSTNRILRDAFQTILYELVENAFIHTKAAFPHYGISLAVAGTPRNTSKGFISAFEAGTHYLEVYVGDLGRGLNANLEVSMPIDYLPPFVSNHEFLKAERVLAYALEFSTTSDKNGRLKRLRELLAQPQIDPSQIATGLHCVTELARSLAGQFLVRTPKAILSFKFYPDRYEPEIKGKKELGLETLGALPGTHYLVRLPLTIRSTGTWYPSAGGSNKSSVSLVTVDPFEKVNASDPAEFALQNAINSVDEFLMKHRRSTRIVILLSPSFPLPSRAEALFIAAIGSMAQGKCLLLWANRHAGITIRNDPEMRTPITVGQAILIGDLFSNSFKAFGHSDTRWKQFLISSDEASERLQLTPSLIKNIRAEHRRALDSKLGAILTHPDVKHTGDSFLLEGQYYTEIFYEIDRAWDQPENIRLFAEWAFAKLNPEIDVLIAHAAPIFPLVEAVAELMKEYWGVEPIVVSHELDQSPAKTISQMVSVSGHRAVIITDVICTADRINRLLSLVTGVELEGILALVDGRAEEARNPIPWLLPTEGRFLQIHALISGKIEVYSDPPKRSRASEHTGDLQDEQVYIIDRATRAPTLYVRPVKPQLNFESLLRGPAKESKSLLNGHTESLAKHYLYFLNFPRLFEHLQRQIMDWVSHQINFIERRPRAREQPWDAYVYVADDSLSWMIEALPELPQKPTVRALTNDHLRAPSPPREGEASGNCIIVLPALASGETARLSLEYVSRKNPATVLLLCIASRMDPYHLTFHSSISKYGGADLHTACFMDFPVPAFPPGRGTCPQCTELSHLKDLRDTVKSYKRNSVDLVEALKRKILANQAIPLGVGLQDDWLAREPSEEDSERAYLRALYESAFVNIDNRRKLNALLFSNVNSIDQFLQILSAERYNKQFSVELLGSILYKAYVAVRKRLLQIILEGKPPLPIGRFMGAIVHMLSHIFAPNAIPMLERYSASPRDVEEICIGLLLVGIEPAGVGEFIAQSRNESTGNALTLFRETLDVLRATQEKDRRDFAVSIEATVQLWAQLARSSQFSEGIGSLAQTSLANYLTMQEVEVLVDQVSREWKNRIVELVNGIESGPLWQKLKSQTSQIPIAVARLENSLARLELLARADEQQRLSASHRFFSAIQATAKELEHSCREIARELYSFMVSPVVCSAAELGPTLLTNDGSELKVIKEIDQSVPRVFCAFGDLESICGQLIGNWKKHKIVSKKGSTVGFKIYSSGTEVVLEFSDDIEGSFDLQSRGGLAFVTECCQAYGGVVKTIEGNGRKSIMVSLNAVEPK